MPRMMRFLLVSVANLIAGAMNALIDGGSFINPPALIALDMPSVQTNAVSTADLFPGGVSSARAYRDGLGPPSRVNIK